MLPLLTRVELRSRWLNRCPVGAAANLNVDKASAAWVADIAPLSSNEGAPLADNPVVVYRAASAQQAYLLKSLLEEQGIETFVVNDMLQAAGGDLPLGWVSLPQLLVGEHDVEKALQAIGNFEATIAHSDSTSATQKSAELGHQYDEHPAGTSVIEAWPTCRKCGERRQVTCDYCGTSGNNFRLVDESTDEGDDERAPLLLCHTCDEQFAAKYYPRCHLCGYLFEPSATDASADDPATRARDLGVESRVLLVIVASIAILSGLIGYFCYVL